MGATVVGVAHNKSDAGAPSVSVTYTVQGAGNAIVVFATHESNITATCDDDNGGSFGTSLGSIYDSSADDQGGDYFVAQNHNAGSTVFTVHVSPNKAYLGIFVVEVSGVPTSGALVGNAAQYQAAASGTDGASSGSFTPTTQPGRIIALCFASDGGAVPAAGSGFTSEGTGWPFSGSDDARVESKAFTTGSTSGTFTPSSSRHCLTMAVALKDSTSSTTLTASAGSFALTGVAMLPKVTMPAAVASFPFTGNAMLPQVAMPAAAASFAFTGVAMLPQVQVPAARGAFPFTGNDAALVVAQILPCSSGSFAFTGVAMLPQVGMPAATGAFAFTGNDAAPTVQIPAAAGAFAFAGNTMLPQVQVPAGTGAFAFTGNDAALSSSGTLIASAGSFPFTGNPMFPTVSVPAVTGAFAFAGNAMLPAVSVPAGTGAFAFTGNDAALSTTTTLTCAAGSFALTGVAMLPQVQVPAARGAFPFTGNAATLTPITGSTGGTSRYRCGVVDEIGGRGVVDLVPWVRVVDDVTALRFHDAIERSSAVDVLCDDQGAAVQPPFLLLDDLPADEIPAWASWLGGRLSASQTGTVFTLTRASDGAERDIGLVGDLIDVDSITAFCVGDVCRLSSVVNAGSAGGTIDQADPALMPIVYSEAALGEIADGVTHVGGLVRGKAGFVGAYFFGEWSGSNPSAPRAFLERLDTLGIVGDHAITLAGDQATATDVPTDGVYGTLISIGGDAYDFYGLRIFAALVRTVPADNSVSIEIDQSDGSFAASVDEAQPLSYGWLIDRAAGGQTSQVRAFVDGVEQVMQPPDEDGATTIPSSSTQFRWGEYPRDSGGGSYSFRGEMSAALCWGLRLSDASRNVFFAWRDAIGS